MGNNIINNNVKDFLNLTGSRPEAEKARYGNTFTGIRKKTINDILCISNLIDEFGHHDIYMDKDKNKTTTVPGSTLVKSFPQE